MAQSGGGDEASIAAVALRKVLLFIVVTGPLLIVLTVLARQWLLEPEGWWESAAHGVLFAAVWAVLHGLLGIWRMKTDPERFKATLWQPLGLRKQ